MLGLLLGVMVAAADVGDRIAAQVLLEQVAGPVRAWAKTATLTKSAVAYNAGALNLDDEAGVHMVKVFDGADCGWTGHRDPDRAARTLRPIEDAARWPISNPRCCRAFGPCPDLIA
ncbi:hypothetical protein ACFY2M_45980 [Streptomyces sp. NPDC001276]|uniref:hypothetical protein n=1 Tax=Streptomyces sp. NPDC001276 TaxID=3364555 RepID=UPI0036871849